MAGRIEIPSEAQEQADLFRWAELQSGAYPELRLLYHIPNGGSRPKTEAAKFKGQGVKSGVPDLCLPVARGKFHGLYIELKRRSGGRVSDTQKKWLSALQDQGYAVIVCRGWDCAREAIMEYLKL